MTTTRWAVLTAVCALASALVGRPVPLRAADPDLAPLPLVLPRPALSGDPPVDAGVRFADVELPGDRPRPVPQVAKGTTNLALHKTVTSNARSCFTGDLAMITDGNKEAYEGSAVEIKGKPCWVQIDLEAAHELSYVCVWHYHREWDVVRHVIVQLSDDPQFKAGVTTVFNNDQDGAEGLGKGGDPQYWETNEGRLIPANGVKARYVRLYSNGDSIDKLNRYTEVEVYGL
jgi:hypothetical protein